jgi:Anti-sigma-K factor rskA/Putative zinc-finger
MDCTTIQELLEEYALGMLEPDLHQQVALHLIDCAECQVIYQNYAVLLATLPETLAMVSPHQLPADGKARLLQRLTQERVPTPNVASISPSFTNGGPVLPLLPSSASGGRKQNDNPVFGVRRLRWALAAATLLLVLALAWTIRLNVVLARERALRAEFVELVGQQHELVLEIVDSAKTTRRVLRATSEGSTAYGKVFTRSDMAHVVAMAARLPQPPPGQAYHLWLTENDQVELAGMMKINQDGFALLIYDAPHNDPVYTSAYLTLQPQGSTTPMGDPVIAWQAEE